MSGTAMETGTSFLFVPATRLDRLGKALASGSSMVIIDLEDAVAPSEKAAARAALAAADLAAGAGRLLVRMNAAGTPWFDGDLALLHGLDIAGAMLPKCESIVVCEDVAARLGPARRLCGLVETARGIAAAPALAASGHLARLAFGSIDFAADLNCGTDEQSLLLARSTLVLASRLADLPPPIDGVTADYGDRDGNLAEARHALKLGFGGKLCIHPKQIGWIAEAFRPSEAEIEQARRILASGDGAVAIDGVMVDAPVRLRAEQILRRAGDPA